MSGYSLIFKNEHIVYEKQVKCTVEESEYNLTYNPSLLTTGSNLSSSIQDFATGSFFQPYATTLGLYNSNNELLAVAKFAKPIAISQNTNMIFIIKLDQ